MSQRLYLPPSEAAEMLGVTIRTIQRMVDDGRLTPDYGGRGGTQRFKVTELRRLKHGPKLAKKPPKGATHGLYVYTRYKCRCGICRDARSRYVAGRQQRTALKPSDKRHGKRSTYTTLGCRCARCTKANNDYAVERRLEREQARRDAAFDKL